MNIKDQVLSINQVQELQELGFDVEKHSLEGTKILQHESGTLLRLLFDNLKWCITNKYLLS